MDTAMDGLRWMLGFTPAADGGDDGHDVTASEYTSLSDSDESIAEDWCVVVEESTRVRTVDISDVHQQRVRNRPRLANWAATEDLLIENPLMPASRPPKSYATVARPSYAQVLKFKAAMQVQAQVDVPTGSAPPDDHEQQGNPLAAVWIAVNEKGVSSSATSRGPCSVHPSMGEIDWLDYCRATRVGRRYLSRTIVHKPRRDATRAKKH